MTEKKPKALYIPRDFSSEPFKKRFVSSWRHFAYYTGQEGYFEEGLDSAFDVTERSAREVAKSTDLSTFDVLVVNYKCEPSAYGDNRREGLRRIAKQSSIPTVLFVGNDRAADMPPDEVLAPYALVVKRECYRDRDRYDLSEANKNKLMTSMLACPLIRRVRTPMAWPIALFRNKRRLVPINDEKQYDVFFAGAVTPVNEVRVNVWKRLTEASDITTYGGLQPSVGDERMPPPELAFDKIEQQTFIDMIHASRINLALDGIGEYTFRHNELWYLGAFMISSPSIRDLELPLPVKEGEHYVTFDSLDDLMEKVRYYKDRAEERDRIARAGKKMFDTHYNPAIHGREIKQVIEGLA